MRGECRIEIALTDIGTRKTIGVKWRFRKASSSRKAGQEVCSGERAPRSRWSLRYAFPNSDDECVSDVVLHCNSTEGWAWCSGSSPTRAGRWMGDGGSPGSPVQGWSRSTGRRRRPARTARPIRRPSRPLRARLSRRQFARRCEVRRRQRLAVYSEESARNDGNARSTGGVLGGHLGWPARDYRATAGIVGLAVPEQKAGSSSLSGRALSTGVMHRDHLLPGSLRVPARTSR
jgi:hypothetical protein